MIPGAYHFLRSGSGAAQAQAFHARVSAHGGPAGLLIALDNEKDADYDTTRAFIAEWNRLSGNHPILMYTGSWWWKPKGWDGASLTPHLWHSRYVDGTGYASSLYEHVPESWWNPGYGGWATAEILQFTSHARVAGMSIDANAYRGSLDDLRALTRPGAASGAPGGSAGPAWPGRLLSYTAGRSMLRGDDVRTWQQRMRNRGWRIDVDGVYGPASAGVCRDFQREKGLSVDGIVGPNTWAAAWTAPVT